MQVRLTTDERRMIDEAAAQRHLTVSAWIRLIALDAARAQGIEVK